ncbi:unnamed protein product [Triticum turgidum subsp. durum]|uniref:Protein kinase domain-containing protein n=1 Tax=Triticum turgidum subsp. durum TaxID=4567 RepID=A0A9R1PXI9_TRITD|nr:unnamed protein product [Triticum turgidum subsp. durum]
MEGSGRQGKGGAPTWAPSEGTVFRPFVAAAGAGAAEPSPSGSGSGVAARISKLHGVKRKPCVARLTADIIHCDLKPENILLAPTAKTAAAVKVIDFGSACLEGKTVYSYIQSRYYRSPEVLLGYPYTTAIDMWSFGCIVAELFIGLPLFPGASEYDVLKRMLKILGGQPPDDLLREAKNTAKFFKHVGSSYLGIGAHDGPGTAYRMLSEDEVEGRETKRPKLGKWYFPQQRLDQLIYTYPWDNTKLPETEKADRVLLVDFLRGLLEFDPNKRWSPFQASGHPFITGEPFTGPYEPVSETPRIPVAHAAAVDHNPGGGHWLVAGLSPQVGSANRCLPPNPYPPKVPFSYGSSYGSLGSHGSYAGNAGLASSYGSYGDVNNGNMYYSPLGPSGFSHVSSSPDIRLRPRLSYDRGIRLSPGGMGPMSLGASPSQFTPPNYQMHTPPNSTGKHGSGSPASGGIHGSPLGKAAPLGQYSKRKNMPMPPHEYASQHGQGRHGDGVSFSHSDAYIRGHAGYSQHSLPSSGHSSWRPQIASRSGFSVEASSSHGPSQAYNSHNAPPLPSFDVLPDTSAPSTLDPSDWDPNYSDESLLQEDNSLSADLSSNLHLRDATCQPGGSARSTRAQSHNFASSNPLLTSQSYGAGQQLHSGSHGRGTRPTVPISYGGFNPPNYPQQSLRGRHGHQFLQPRYNQPTNSHMRSPMGSHQSGQPAWPPYGMGEGVPWGGTGVHPFTTGGLPSSLPRKDYGSIF